MVPIPVGRTFIVTVMGRVVKPVTCERCRGEYAYHVTRKVRGKAFSLLFLNDEGASATARRRAKTVLDAALAAGVDPVACPTCGWYQEAMVLAARSDRGMGFKVMGLVAAGVGAIAVCIVFVVRARDADLRPSWILAGSLLVSSLVLFGLRHLRCANWSPNSDTMWRRRAQPKEADRLIPAGEYDRLLAAQKAAAVETGLGSATSPSPPGIAGSPDRA